MKRGCFISGCHNPHLAKNFCQKHYNEAYFLLKPNPRKKQKLAAEVGSYIGLSTNKSREIVTIVWNVVTEALRRKEDVEITGVGKFFVINNKVEFKVSPKIDAILNKEQDVHN